MEDIDEGGDERKRANECECEHEDADNCVLENDDEYPDGRDDDDEGEHHEDIS